MKTSAQLAWTKKQRAALHGARAPHRFDPPRRDRTKDAWERIAGWVAESQALRDASPDAALRADVASVRAETALPPRHDARREALRVVLATAGLESRTKHTWNEPGFAEAFADAWASQGIGAALAHPSRAPRFVGHHGSLCLEEEIPPTGAWLDDPWRLGGRYLNVGYEYFATLRRRVFELDAAGYASALDEGAALRERVLASESADRVTMLFVLAFVFSRDGRWARELAEEALETPQYDGFAGVDLLVPSLTDARLALALVKRRRAWIEPYGFNLPLLLDVVESLGSEAVPVLRAIDTSMNKPRVQKRVDEAVALASS